MVPITVVEEGSVPDVLLLRETTEDCEPSKETSSEVYEESERAKDMQEKVGGQQAAK